MSEPVYKKPLITAEQARERMPSNYTDQFDEKFEWISDQIQHRATEDYKHIYLYCVNEKGERVESQDKYINCPEPTKIVGGYGGYTLFFKRLLTVFNELGYTINVTNNYVYIKWQDK